MTEEDIREKLQAMEVNPQLVTKSGYRANAQQWPDNHISFIDTHLLYLRLHPAVSPAHYLSNLRLMLRSRP